MFLFHSQKIVLEAARDELLAAFYGSQIFEVVLSLLQGRQVTAALAGESGRPLDFLQRTLRGIVLPEGIALHRRARTKETPHNGDKVGQQTAGVVRLLSFCATVTSEQSEQRKMVVEASLGASLQLSDSLHCSADCVIAIDEKEKVSAGMVQFLVPEDRMREGEPQLYSFVVTQKDGSYIYGASLVAFTAEKANEKVLVKEGPAGDVLLGEKAVDSSFGDQLVDLSPLDSAGAESAGGACESHAVDDTFFGSILSKSHSSQTLSRVTDGAGQLLRGIRQWGELALPPHISSVSSVSSLRSLSVSVSVSGASPSVVEPITPLTPSLWELGATLSSAWTRPSAQVKPPLQILEEIEASDEMCGLWGTEDGEIEEFDQRKPGRFNGVALLSARPAVQGLRKPLGALAPLLPSDGDCDAAAAAWPRIVSALTESEHISSLLQSATSTEDFNPEVVFETLSAQNLATIYLAMLVILIMVFPKCDTMTLTRLFVFAAGVQDCAGFDAPTHCLAVGRRVAASGDAAPGLVPHICPRRSSPPGTRAATMSCTVSSWYRTRHVAHCPRSASCRRCGGGPRCQLCEGPRRLDGYVARRAVSGCQTCSDPATPLCFLRQHKFTQNR